MGFQCPDCNKKTLNILERIELAPDARSDEITLQVIHCGSCKFEGLAVYEESRRGALDSESIDHYGYRLVVKDLMVIRSLIKRCPEPLDPWCKCETHQRLNKRDSFGRWIRPGFSIAEKTFSMDY